MLANIRPEIYKIISFTKIYRRITFSGNFPLFNCKCMCVCFDLYFGPFISFVLVKLFVRHKSFEYISVVKRRPERPSSKKFMLVHKMALPIFLATLVLASFPVSKVFLFLGK